MATKSAAAVVDWTKIYTGLGLDKHTVTALQSFRARHSAAMNKNTALKNTTTEIDLSHYKSVLKDQQAVQLAEKVLREFKAVDYDVSKWNGAVEAFEGKAVTAAKETLSKVSAEETSLQATLANIKEARPFEELTTEEVSKARPEITKTTETMIKKGKWTVTGYKEKFGDLSLM